MGIRCARVRFDSLLSAMVDCILSFCFLFEDTYGRWLTSKERRKERKGNNRTVSPYSPNMKT